MKKVNKVVIVEGWKDTYHRQRNTEELDNLLEDGWLVESVHTPTASAGGETTYATMGDIVFVLLREELRNVR